MHCTACTTMYVHMYPCTTTYICMHVLLRMYVCMYYYVCTYVSMYYYVHMYACTTMYVRMYLCTTTYICIHVLLRTYVCMYYYVCTYVSMYYYVCIYTVLGTVGNVFSCNLDCTHVILPGNNSIVSSPSRAPWIMGWSEDQVLGKSPFVFGHPDDTFGNKYEENVKKIEKCCEFGLHHVCSNCSVLHVHSIA